ncbi:CMRF35-like molecule 9 isoform X1 [Passer montanus]|uniref:CMRF35-like molecule 9 isoform X1 n=1 Tax=Passer montanus TaxID=9160 RepID=UPI001960999D|nr:CMRF35-like molecule 9 isoform X1 [Passer montanus]
MGMMLRAAVLLSSLLHCSAFLELSGPSEIKGVWKDSVTLPCAYVPVEELVQQTLTWTVVHDKGSGTIFRRDDSGDHILLAEYRDRVSIPKNAPGNVSLLILSLEISDRGTYTCQVTWRDSNNSLIAKEITTSLEVVKEKPQTELVPGGTSGTSWTPWGPTTTADLPITATTSESGVGYPGKNETIRDSQRTGLSLYLVILIAVVCGAVVFLVISLIMCMRKPKDAQVYDVKLHNLKAAASSSTGHYEEPISATENSYVMELGENKVSEEVNKNVPGCVANPQESEYEVGDTS